MILLQIVGSYTAKSIQGALGILEFRPRFHVYTDYQVLKDRMPNS